MATITIEIGRKGKKKTRAVSFLVCHGKTKKRIPTEIFVTDSDVSTNGKKIKNLSKAKLIEEMRRKLEDRLFSLSLELVGQDVDAAFIVERLTSQRDNDIEFFAFAEDWIGKSSIKGMKNYSTMLNSLESYIGIRELPFSRINYKLLKGYEDFLVGKERAQSLYLGMIRHLYREAMRMYNNDHEQVIKNDPFMRYNVPRQQLKKGIRALSLEDLLKIYDYQGKPGSRAQLARDCFVLSFCLMGMNSVDMYNCADIKDDVIMYQRTKTKARRSDSAYIEVRIHPFIRELVHVYKGNGHVFNFYKRYTSYKTFNANINKGLKVVGEAVGIEGLEFYQARHTFATLSRNLMKFSKSDVDEALNHVGTLDIADVYIKKDFTIINENNFALINKVFGLHTKV